MKHTLLNKQVMLLYDAENKNKVDAYDVLNEEQYQSLQQRFGDTGFVAKMGGEVIRDLLASIDLVEASWTA